jgi:hypothetical protein
MAGIGAIVLRIIVLLIAQTRRPTGRRMGGRGTVALVTASRETAGPQMAILAMVGLGTAGLRTETLALVLRPGTPRTAVVRQVTVGRRILRQNRGRRAILRAIGHRPTQGRTVLRTIGRPVEISRLLSHHARAIPADARRQLTARLPTGSRRRAAAHLREVDRSREIVQLRGTALHRAASRTPGIGRPQAAGPRETAVEGSRSRSGITRNRVRTSRAPDLISNNRAPSLRADGEALPGGRVRFQVRRGRAPDGENQNKQRQNRKMEDRSVHILLR